MTILRMSQIWNRRLHRLQTCPLCLHRLQTRPLHDRSEQVLQPPHRAGQGRTSPLLQLRELPPRGRERQLPRQPQIRPLCLHCLQNRLLHDQSVHVLQPQIRLLRLRCLQSRLLHDQSVQVLRPPRLTGKGRLSPGCSSASSLPAQGEEKGSCPARRSSSSGEEKGSSCPSCASCSSSSLTTCCSKTQEVRLRVQR